MGSLTLEDKYPLLTMEVAKMSQQELGITPPALTNADRQKAYKARLRETAARGEATLHLVNEFEGLALQLAWKGDALGKELVELADGQGLAGIVRNLHRRRQEMAAVEPMLHVAKDRRSTVADIMAEALKPPAKQSPATRKTRNTGAQRSHRRGAAQVVASGGND